MRVIIPMFDILITRYYACRNNYATHNMRKILIKNSSTDSGTAVFSFVLEERYVAPHAVCPCIIVIAKIIHCDTS